MPTVFSKNFQLNLTPIINSQNIISDYRLHKLGNGESINVKTCGSNRCKEFCPRFVPSDFVYSSSLDRYFKCINKEFPKVVNCKSQNVIYLITCAKCFLQYVGETCTMIGKRFCTHRACMSGKTYATSCKRLADHFTSGPCKGAEHVVQIIENWCGNGYLPNGKVDWENTKERQKQEDQWMLKLRTVYPYGLNDSLNFPSKDATDNHEPVGRSFPSLPRKFSRPNHRVFNKTSPKSNHQIFVAKLRHILKHHLHQASKFIRVSLYNMSKKELKSLAVDINHAILNDEDDAHSAWFKMILDIIETKLYKPPVPKTTKRIPKYRISIPFVNKALDFINLPQIIRSKHSKENMPPMVSDEDIPMIVYSLAQPIRSKILNYKKFVKELDLDRFKEDHETIKCNCQKYSVDFVNPERQHVLTGNLKIVKNNKLRKLFSKGPKYREPVEIKWEEAKGAVEDGLNTFMEGLSTIKKISPLALQNWKNSILEQVDSKIGKKAPVIKSQKALSVFNDNEAKAELKCLQNDFVIVPIDKAANNIAFICKQHYAHVLVSELKYNQILLEKSPTDTYEFINRPCRNIVQEHVTKLSQHELELDEGMDCLPLMYWIPKIHKNPVGNRFIVASPKCSLKPLLKDVTCILKLFQHQIKSFHDKNRVWTGVSNFWVIQNNAPVVERIDKINKKKQAVSVRTFDFSTLYTKIPHHLLRDALFEIVDFCFKGGISHGVYVTKAGAFWRNPSKDYRLYSKESIKSVLEYVIDNAFFQVGSKIFRQVIGIPMGSDPAPFIANLFLYVYENRFMTNLKKTDLSRAKNLRHVFRFIDDLIALNDNDEFMRSHKDIYPPEMELKVENENNYSASYLDLAIELNEGIAETKLFDKRDTFKFSVVRMPHKRSNIPQKMFYATIGAEVLRICRATSNYVFFLDSSRKLITRMCSQGADTEGIQRVLTKMINRHWEPFVKFNLSSEKIASDVSSSST